jgi:hypothetical protein
MVVESKNDFQGLLTASDRLTDEGFFPDATLRS